jgi:hypothetical protein
MVIHRTPLFVLSVDRRAIQPSAGTPCEIHCAISIRLSPTLRLSVTGRYWYYKAEDTREKKEAKKFKIYSL